MDVGEKITKIKEFSQRVDADLVDFKNYLDSMKEPDIVSRLFGITKEKHKKLIQSDN